MTRKAPRFLSPRRFAPRLLLLTTAAVLSTPVGAYALIPWHSDGRVPATIVKGNRTRGENGVSFNIPEPYGTQMTYEANTTEGNVFGPWAAGTRQRLVWEAWMAKGHVYDNGISTLDGYYLVACTRAFGNPGDRVDFELDNGIVIHCIVGDTKNLMDEDCNIYGHANGACVCEWLVDPYSAGPQSGLGGPGHAGWLPEWSGRVVKATNFGLWDGFPFSAETISAFVDSSIDATAWVETAMLMASQKDTGYLLGAQHDDKPYDPALGIDCSSFVRHALILSGAFTDEELEPFSTYTQERVLTGLGFEMHEITDVDELQSGDILWCSGHTEIYIGRDILTDDEGNVIPGPACIGARYDYDQQAGDGNQVVDGEWLGDGTQEVGASLGISGRFTHYFRSKVATHSWLGAGSIPTTVPRSVTYADGTRVVNYDSFPRTRVVNYDSFPRTRVVNYAYFPGHEPAAVEPGPDVWQEDSYDASQVTWSYDEGDYDDGASATAPEAAPAPSEEAPSEEPPSEEPAPAPDAPAVEDPALPVTLETEAPEPEAPPAPSEEAPSEEPAPAPDAPAVEEPALPVILETEATEPEAPDAESGIPSMDDPSAVNPSEGEVDALQLTAETETMIDPLPNDAPIEEPMDIGMTDPADPDVSVLGEGAGDPVASTEMTDHVLSEPPVIEEPDHGTVSESMPENVSYAYDGGYFDEWNGYENGYVSTELYSYGDEYTVEPVHSDDDRFELAPDVALAGASKPFDEAIYDEPYVEPTGGVEATPTTD